MIILRILFFSKKDFVAIWSLSLLKYGKTIEWISFHEANMYPDDNIQKKGKIGIDLLDKYIPSAVPHISDNVAILSPF